MKRARGVSAPRGLLVLKCPRTSLSSPEISRDADDCCDGFHANTSGSPVWSQFLSLVVASDARFQPTRDR